MKRTRSQTASTTTPVKSSSPPPKPTKKTKYLSAQQMQAAFLHVTQPVIPVTTPPPPPPHSTPAAAPSPPPAPEKPPPTPKKAAPQPINPSYPKVKVTPPPSVSLEAAQLLFKLDPLRFTPSSLQCDFFKASVLSPHSPDYTTISEYITNSQAHGFKIDLVSVLKITRPPPSPAPQQDSLISSKPFTMMLWHGTRPQFVASILYNGFMCPSSGLQMFGQGVYFADRISKSAQYTHPSVYCSIPKAGDTGYLFLCEVVLGKIYNAKKSNSGYKSAPTATRQDGSVMSFDSLMCTGAQVPDRKEQREIEGVTWPLGPTIQNTKFPSYTVNYNEYIVYNPKEMVDIKYLVEVKFS